MTTTTDATTTPFTATSGPGIEQWPDAEAIEAACRALVAQPIRPIARDRYDEYLAWFDTSCAGSKAAAEEAQRFAQILISPQRFHLAPQRLFPLALRL